ncbi:MAG: hypothetical protein IE931_08370 [Sphingobacteriales bacterium]|nr:hypothetical protein [Sphingobacteriales bacterium]
MRKFILFTLYISVFSYASAQSLTQNENSTKSKHYHIIAEYQILKSTHSTKFKGFNVIFSKNITAKKSLGLGIEYACAPFHGDNGYYLYHLNFIPVFIDYRYHFNQKRLSPFVIADVGYSFVTYERELIGSPSSREKIKEGGIYLQGDFGFSYKLNKYIEPLLSIGFKGFHNSFNNLDINPHGLTFRAGLLINL